MTLRDAVAQIQKFHGRLSGSRAYGEPREDSDWDFWMPERQVMRLRRWLDDNREPWDSPFIGSITFYPQMAQVEVSFLFPRNRKQHEAQDRRRIWIVSYRTERSVRSLTHDEVLRSNE